MVPNLVYINLFTPKGTPFLSPIQIFPEFQGFVKNLISSWNFLVTLKSIVCCMCEQSLFDKVPFAALDSCVYSTPIIWFVFSP